MDLELLAKNFIKYLNDMKGGKSKVGKKKDDVSSKMKKIGQDKEDKPYWENTHQTFAPEWIKQPDPEKNDDDDDEEKNAPKGKALLKKVYGGASCKCCLNSKDKDKVVNVESHLTPANKISKRDHLWSVSNPKLVQQKAFHFYGKNAIVYKSTRPNKKYQILNPDGKWVHFGDYKMMDFTKHQDLQRRKNYLARASKIKGNWRQDDYSPNKLAILLLW